MHLSNRTRALRRIISFNLNCSLVPYIKPKIRSFSLSFFKKNPLSFNFISSQSIHKEIKKLDPPIYYSPSNPCGISYPFSSSQKDDPLPLKVIDTPSIPSNSEEQFPIAEYTPLSLFTKNF